MDHGLEIRTPSPALAGCGNSILSASAERTGQLSLRPPTIRYGQMISLADPWIIGSDPHSSRQMMHDSYLDLFYR